ncbi:MAG: LTA synthase family protein [Oscillospiraceae bacterium]|nr:LTA synthase family protein [Oscillospiraceae bacterium]
MMKVKEKTKANRPKAARQTRIVWYVIVGLAFMLATTLYVLCRWFLENFNVGLNELFFSLASPLKGAGTGVVSQLLQDCLPPILGSAVIFTVLALLDYQCRASIWITGTVFQHRVSLNLRKVLRRVTAASLVLTLPVSIFYIDQNLGLLDYLKTCMKSTSLYDEYYVDPLSVGISATGKTKNLIYIYLESMETTYASVEAGGAQEINFIPNLTALASTGVSFSDSELLGGFHSVTGSGWTMGALLSSTAGVPFAFPVNGNSMNERASFAGGLTTLGDVLQSNGYTQEFLCGSDADFAGRRTYFSEHGDYDIFDLYTAREEGYIGKDYYVWWGFEDKILYEIAKDEVSRLANEGKPFNLTMLTADTHHEGGYVCDLCGDTYDVPLENVLLCADEQLADFISWLQQQDFYENTVVVITGDHPRMDTILVDDVDYYDRTGYNCFLNAAATVQHSAVNREFTTLDLFPTTLAAMGFEIDGNRLGLGTNLFSTERTLAEQLGFDDLNGELGKHSSYYLRHFS